MKTNIQRVELHQKIPLHTPFSLHVFPAYYCNFRCSYCLHSLSEEKLEELNFKKQTMDFETFKKAIDSLKEFQEKLKAIIFAGHGEPLINKDIDKMVKYAKMANVADRIEIVTNASLLNQDLSDRLIEAGLDRLRISIQGVTAEKYKKVCGTKIDFNKFVENIAYFFEKRKETDMYIKIIDIALNDKSEEQIFYNIFKPICDTAAIEYTIPFVKEIDYSKFDTDFKKCKQGNEQSSKICSMPFYMLVLQPNGDIVPCCSTKNPIVYGNVNCASLKNIWSSENVKKFLRLQLIDRNSNAICKECSVPSFGLQQGDYLDQYANDLIKYY